MPQVILLYKGWVLTDNGIITCNCMYARQDLDYSSTRCRYCNNWMTVEVYNHLYRTWELVKPPGAVGFGIPGNM